MHTRPPTRPPNVMSVAGQLVPTLTNGVWCLFSSSFFFYFSFCNQSVLQRRAVRGFDHRLAAAGARGRPWASGADAGRWCHPPGVRVAVGVPERVRALHCRSVAGGMDVVRVVLLQQHGPVCRGNGRSHLHRDRHRHRSEGDIETVAAAGGRRGVRSLVAARTFDWLRLLITGLAPIPHSYGRLVCCLFFFLPSFSVAYTSFIDTKASADESAHARIASHRAGLICASA